MATDGENAGQPVAHSLAADTSASVEDRFYPPCVCVCQDNAAY